MLIQDFTLREIEWTPEEESSATELVKETLRRARAGPVLRALTYLTAALGFDSFVFGTVANDRRPDSQTRAYIITNQAKDWVSKYDDRSYLEIDPRIDLAGEPGCFYWEAAQFDQNTSYKVFLAQAAAYGIRSGLVVGLCTRNPPSYTMFALNCVAPKLPWNVQERMDISGQALIVGTVISRALRKYLIQQELLFETPPMRLTVREREILTLCASGKTTKEVAETLELARITVDVHMKAIQNKLGALNRNQAIAIAIANKLIRIMDDGQAEFKSAKMQADRDKSGTKIKAKRGISKK